MRLSLFLLASVAFAQTQVDWNTQIKNSPFVTPARYNFPAQRPGGTLTASTPATVTLTPGPVGVSGSQLNYFLYVSAGTGTAEAVKVTGGTCNGALQSSCTVTFTPANNHSGNWTISPVACGLSEAVQVLGAAGGYIWLPAGACNMYGSVTIPRNVILEGAGDGSVLNYLPSTGVALIKGDHLTNGLYSPYQGRLSSFKLVGGGATNSTIGILSGGDPAGTLSPTDLNGQRWELYQVHIYGFGDGFKYGNNSYNIKYQDDVFEANSVGIHVPTNSANCCSAERIYGGEMLGNIVSAIQADGPYVEFYGYGADIEYNKRGLYMTALSSGGVFSCYACQFENWSDNTSSPVCLTNYQGVVGIVNTCGDFIDIQGNEGVHLTMSGATMNYSDPTVGHANQPAQYILFYGNTLSASFDVVEVTASGGATPAHFINATDIGSGNSTITASLASNDAGPPAFTMSSTWIYGNVCNNQLMIPGYGILNGLCIGSVAAASTISVPAPVFHVTGTVGGGISVILTPTNMVSGSFCTIPDAAWTTNTFGNIAIASTAVVGRQLCFTRDAGTGKLYPSY